MVHPTELILRDVRCFEGEQRSQLRPITLLVGENSTGKTTLLGCYAALHRLLSHPTLILIDRPEFDDLNFNERPFAMGSFRDIVRSRRGRSGRIDEFKLGFALEPEQSALPCSELTATFQESGSQPVVSSLRLGFSDGWHLALRRTDSGGSTLEAPGHPGHETALPLRQAESMLWLLSKGDPSLLDRFPNLKPISQHLVGLCGGKGGKRAHAKRRNGFALPRLSELIPVAPLRSKPKRTYDPVRETASPEGEHIPMLIMRLDRTAKEHWVSLHDDLVDFGRDAGLFSDVKVKRHGKQMSDPFQLQVKVRSGPHANIMDVGYGISQSLPILVDIMANPAARGALHGPREGRTFLLQQPEVHLHPRGQAQLASLFIDAFRKRNHRFLIETHSDHIVDRVRISVRQGRLKPDDVSILYFEPNRSSVDIHNLVLDADGNLQGAPAGYREFFLRETDKLLGFAD